jgi:hypothetical protein
VLEGSGRSFDPEVVDIFRTVVAPYPPGGEVQLSDGRRGVVASVPVDRIDVPVVRIGWDEGGRAVSPYEVDMATVPDLELSCLASNPAAEVERDPPPAPPSRPGTYPGSRQPLTGRR